MIIKALLRQVTSPAVRELVHRICTLTAVGRFLPYACLVHLLPWLWVISGLHSFPHIAEVTARLKKETAKVDDFV